ncbi:CRISPR-associated protein, Csn1 family [Fibrobacter succinogenes subsp. succinogenes S85]|uniref:CRISPR-associated endonuclease Cas9 n=1 Tax=Fibrobacter succinogenes (strain ATCC 19169 / S85) TaxID=59374 RepID=C9RJP1_FIBSS|nr:type II CRISPR RNA-guided endonuclease Cas9 [Fibrobacter succinogenes]ACX73754.1 CRISPR-associated protein, Csn1 family [Fibrobacter succinogenes subsp. succinogenes S85]ADL24757.1 CRISPR-associated protein, Csn1 family [Fibrobacter succinogenes subsp. succinogenes S85]
MKKILGLDLGTNSIGWAVVNADEITRDDGSRYLKPNGISAAGSRIIPMSADILGDFEKGNSISQTAERTRMRMARRLHERALLRRERLLRVLNLLDFLPKHFADKIDRYGKFTDDSEPKLAWRKNTEGKYEFIFQDAFNEMLAEFKDKQPEIVEEGKKIPYDWTIYYLRKKALEKALSKEELSWILLQFNQKRGYYQLRGEEEEIPQDKKIEYLAQKVVKVEATDQKKGDDVWYNVYLENGMIYRRTSKAPLDWEGKVKEFIVTTEVENDGETPKKDKEGNIKRSFRAPKEDDWTLLKKKTEADIENSHKTVGCYIYDSLLNNPKQKIIGKLVRTVERKFYKEELTQILKKQVELIPELRDDNLYKQCIEELYPINEAHRNTIAKTDFANLFINDILFYQRPLKSKKSQIDNCPYEERIFIDSKTGEKKKVPVKCIAKSNPLFQEFRLWQFIQNLRIYQREKEIDGKLLTDIDITSECLKSEEDYVRLFDWLNDRETIEQEDLLKHLFNTKKSKNKENPYRWNYVEDKVYPCNETRATILKGFSKCGINASVLSPELEMALWHILYSVEDKKEIETALTHFAQKQGWNDDFAKVFSKAKPFKKDYGSYSEKAIKKLLSLMRMGKYWNQDNIDKNTLDRIDKIINGEYDEKISNRVRDNAINLKDISDFRGLPVWLACYIVYDRHSEAKDCTKWNSPEEIDSYLKKFKQHSLRNPIVEQVVTETLRTVRDIWIQEEQIDEIHLELGRDLKNPADKRKKMSENILKNENTNLRIKAMLMEFMNPSMGIENVRPYSPSQQDILRIYEENALDNLTKDDKDFDFISKISKQAQPSKTDIIRYKCWLEQKYRSPYTGKTISLSKLFTPAYEIEHVIPQSLYFDDSFSNKVICEAEVNKLKDRQLGYKFIAEHHGEKVQLSQGEVVEILSVDAYEKFVKENYANNRIKMKKLLMESIPDEFIERQLNDSRYISKVVKGLLSNIVREKIDDENYEPEAVSKNLISCNGAITDRLKKDWGMNDVWNSIILPRFIRMNQITGKDCFTTTNAEGHLIPQMPLELQKGFNKKRIDHRHHAMDAIVIACTTRDHVNLLNNEAAHSKFNATRYQLQRKLRRFEKAVIDGKEREVAKEFLKPWDSFSSDSKNILENIIVSFKQNQRVINKTTNAFLHFDENGKKTFIKQGKGDSWAIRKSMHKDTVFGEINLRKVRSVSLNEAIKVPERVLNKKIKEKILELKNNKIDAKNIKKYIEENHTGGYGIDSSKIDVFYFTKETKERFFATRKTLDTSFNQAKIKDSIADSGIQKILLAHLKSKNGDAEQAFSPDGIDEMNKNIVELNNGKFHQPILKVRVYEKADKFAVGQKGNKKVKFVEAAKGTNLFFAIFEKDGKRSYLTIPLNVMIDCQKQYGNQWKNNIEAYLKEKELVEKDVKLQFILSPNDLVYLPTEGSIDKKRIYKVVSFTNNRLYAIPYAIAKSIVDKNEFTQLNKIEFTDNKESIKDACVPVIIDRLGNVIEFNGKRL